MLGLPKWQIDAMFPVGGLLNAGQEASPERIEAIGGDPQGLLAPERPNGFWQGGEKIRGKDALAGLLAVISDTASQLGGNQGNAIEGLLGGRSSALDEFKKKAEQERKMQQTMALIQQAYPNLSPAQQQAMAAGVGDYADFKKPEPDAFTQTLINAGIDPESDEGKTLYRQRASTQALPAPSLIGSPETGYRWAQPPAPTMGKRRELTPEEIKQLGLPEGGPGGNRPGGFPRGF